MERSCFECSRLNTSRTDFADLSLQAGPSLDAFTFYSSLHDYSRPREQRSSSMMSDDDEEPPLGRDGDLVAALVGSAVIPRLGKLFEAGAYDPYSSRETRKAVDVVEQVEELLGRESAKFQVRLLSSPTLFVSSQPSTQPSLTIPVLSASQALLSSVLSPFSSLLQSLTSLVLLCIQNAISSVPTSTPSPRVRFLYRLTKLIKNALAFQFYAPERVSELVNGFAEVGRIVSEHGGAAAWEGEGGRKWAEGLLVGVEGKGVLEVERERRLRSGPPRGW